MGKVIRIEIGRVRHGKLSLPVYKPVPKFKPDVPYRSSQDVISAEISKEIARAEVVKAATHEKPTTSWWVGCDREEFTRRRIAEHERLAGTKIGQQQNLTHGDDVPRVRTGTAVPSASYEW